MGMQCCFVIRKPDFYYLLFEKAVVQTTAKTCPYLSHLAQICLAFDKLGSWGSASIISRVLLYTPQQYLSHFLPHAFNCYSNENNRTILPMKLFLTRGKHIENVIVSWRKELGYVSSAFEILLEVRAFLCYYQYHYMIGLFWHFEMLFVER